MQHAAVEKIKHAVNLADHIAHADLAGCDVSDIEEIMQSLERELNSAHPNKQTLATYLNSLARSLRSDPAARKVCLQLDTAMREAGIASNWEEF